MGVGCHSLSPGDLPDPEIECRSPALQADSLPSEQLGKHIERPPKSPDLGRIPSLSGSHVLFCFFLSFYRGYSYLFHGVVAKINGIISHMWILKNACPIRKQRMLQPLQNSSWVVSPEGTQDTNRRPSAKPSATADGPWGDSRWESTRSWDAYQRNDISELKLLHLPIRRKPSVPQFEISGFL